MFLPLLLGLLLGFVAGILTEQWLAKRPRLPSAVAVTVGSHRAVAPACWSTELGPPDTLRSAPDHEPPTVATGVRS